LARRAGNAGLGSWKSSPRLCDRDRPRVILAGPAKGLWRRRVREDLLGGMIRVRPKTKMGRRASRTQLHGRDDTAQPRSKIDLFHAICIVRFFDCRPGLSRAAGRVDLAAARRHTHGRTNRARRARVLKRSRYFDRPGGETRWSWRNNVAYVSGDVKAAGRHHDSSILSPISKQAATSFGQH